MKKILLMILPTTLLGGCLSLKGITTTAGATSGAVLGGLVNPQTAVIGGVIGGLGADAAIPTPAASVDDVDSFWQLLAFMWQNFTSHLISIAVVVTIIWILTGYLGIRARRPEEKALEQALIKRMTEDK